MNKALSDRYNYHNQCVAPLLRCYDFWILNDIFMGKFCKKLS